MNATQENKNPREIHYLCPRTDIRETKESFIVQAEMPGVNKQGLEITVTSDQLTIVGHRNSPQPAGTAAYRETRGSDYKRVFDLDPMIDHEKISAAVEQGVLTLTLPKAEAVKPRRITVGD